jgi:hypothetical protein
MALRTIHHWTDPELGLREVRRVTRGPVLVLTFDLERSGIWDRRHRSLRTQPEYGSSLRLVVSAGR